MVLVDTTPPITPEARLQQLEEQRTSYYQLLQRLETLPRKLRHPGLIPVAPRLFLKGELVRTNEVLVLLGRSGDESFLAERSAWQAKGIVQRRLDIVDQHVNNIIKNVDNHVDHHKPYAIKPNTPLPSILVDTSNGTTRKSRGRRVTFRDPVYTEFGSVILQKQQKQSQQQPKQQQQQQKKQQKPPPPLPPSSASSKRVSKAKPPPVPKVQSSASHFNSVIIPNKSQPVAKVESQPKNPSKGDNNKQNHSNSSIDITSHKPSISNARADDHSNPERENVHSEFTQAIRNAHTQQLQEGVINITEFYEDGSDQPTKVDIPSYHTPDDNTNFEDDVTAYLDVTGTKNNEKQPQPMPEDYWDALIEAEREEEEKEHKRKTKEAKTTLEKEKKEFGTGFSKGFFGNPSSSKKKQEKQKTNTTVLEIPAAMSDIDTSKVSKPVVAAQQTVPAQPEQESHYGIGERIVERKPKSAKARASKRKSHFRNRIQQQQQLSGTPAVDSILVMEKDQGEEELEEIILEREDMESNTEEGISQFRQLRNLRRQGA